MSGLYKCLWCDSTAHATRPWVGSQSIDKNNTSNPRLHSTPPPHHFSAQQTVRRRPTAQGELFSFHVSSACSPGAQGLFTQAGLSTHSRSMDNIILLVWTILIFSLRFVPFVWTIHRKSFMWRLWVHLEKIHSIHKFRQTNDALDVMETCFWLVVT